MDKKRVLGFSKFTSKKGNYCVVLDVASPYGDRQKENGACGEKVEQLFIPEPYHGKVVPAIIGKDISLKYDISGGRAYLDGFEVCG